MVYVDEAIWEWRGKLWCHLVADSLDELHEFAAHLGLRFSWFQGASRFPHYDLSANKRLQAIKLGAQAITARTAVLYARRVRAGIVHSHQAQADLFTGDMDASPVPQRPKCTVEESGLCF